jgi:hypothetical protein
MFCVRVKVGNDWHTHECSHEQAIKLANKLSARMVDLNERTTVSMWSDVETFVKYPPQRPAKVVGQIQSNTVTPGKAYIEQVRAQRVLLKTLRGRVPFKAVLRKKNLKGIVTNIDHNGCVSFDAEDGQWFVCGVEDLRF